MHPHPSVTECQIAHVRGRRHDAAAGYSHDHPHPDLESHPACAPVADHVPPVAAKGGKPGLWSLPVPRLGWLSLRVEVVHRVCLLGSTGQLEALPSILVVHRAWVYPVQKVKAKHRVELLSPPAVPARVCLVDPA